jgi:hypothetical protein
MSNVQSKMRFRTIIHFTLAIIHLASGEITTFTYFCEYSPKSNAGN